jgi:aminobutyraldehyde dehydrogenase
VRFAGEYLPGYHEHDPPRSRGVVASIAPWNYPLMMAAWKLSPALAGGNTIVLKPSEQTPLTTLKLATLLRGAVPARRREYRARERSDSGAALISQPQVAMISLTGDVSTGEKGAAGRRRKAQSAPTLELGGKAPVIVFDDADREAVVSGVRTFGFYNAGRTALLRVASTPGRRSTTSWSRT